MSYENLNQKVLALYEKLLEKQILIVKIPDGFSTEYADIVSWILGSLKETYPDIKLKRIMKSIHYANGFQDENLKNTAFLLDEVEQILSKLGRLDHDLSVDFFNREIRSKEVNQISLSETMIESLLLLH
ncbi:hypothetical protein AGMMS49983_15310 [Clostridia bacterium]|nr:hypothetical protein AGMMS49983_15310 [Clostridia bacterium]